MDEFNEGIIAGYVRTVTADNKPIIEQTSQLIEYVMDPENPYSFGLSLYIDRGYSAISTDRPAYMQLMNDIAAGKIHEVIVTKMEVLNRDVKAFEEIINLARIENVTITTIL